MIVRKKRNDCCPVCESTAYEDVDHDFDDGIILVSCSCHDCGTDFVQVYRFVHATARVHKEVLHD